MKTILLSFLITLPAFVFSQTPELRHTVKMGVDIPLQYKLGYSYRISEKVSVNAGAGLLVAPFDDMLIGLMEGFGVDEGIGRLMRSSFKNGKIFTFGGNYFLNKKYYTGARMNYGIFTAEDSPFVLLNGIFPTSLLEQISPEVKLEVQSKVWFGGFLVGRQFQLGSPKWVLNTELAVSKAFSSENTTKAKPSLPLGRLDDDLDQLLTQSYNDYGYVISINFHLGYRF